MHSDGNLILRARATRVSDPQNALALPSFHLLKRYPTPYSLHLHWIFWSLSSCIPDSPSENHDPFLEPEWTAVFAMNDADARVRKQFSSNNVKCMGD